GGRAPHAGAGRDGRAVRRARAAGRAGASRESHDLAPRPAMRALLLASCLLAPLAAHAQTTPLWTATPELRIGSLDRADYALTEVHDLAVDAAGNLYVAQRTEGLIRVFDARGRFVRTVGRRGAGPGEFQDIARIGLRGDTLWATDFVQARLS